MVERQSKSLPEAIQDYSRRYWNSRPKSDVWYEMAADANVTLIDVYDLLMQDLATFGGKSAEYLHFRTRMVSENEIQMS